MLAKTTGICIFCDGFINIGDDIQWGKKGARKGMLWHVPCKPSTVTDEETEETESTPPPVNGNGNGNGNGHHNASANDPLGAMMATAVLPYIREALQSSGKVDADQVKAICEDLIKSVQFPRSLEVTVNGNVGAKIESAHPMLDQIIPLIANGFHIYLYGAAGGGKTTAMQHVAKALDYEFILYSCSPFSTPIELRGYMSPSGAYVPGLLKLAKLRAALTGKNVLLLVDESDRSRQDFLPCLNSFLAQGTTTLPNGEELSNGNVIVALAGNTPGRGASAEYNSASQMDASVLDRFAVIEWTYDEDLERRIAANDAWVNYVQSVRRYVARADSKAKLLVSPRASIEGSKVLRTCPNITIAQLADMWIFKGIAPDTKTRVLAACPLPTSCKAVN